MNRIKYYLIVSLLILNYGCNQNEENLVEIESIEKDLKNDLFSRDINIEDGVKPTTHDELPGFEYEEGYSSEDATVQYKYLGVKVQYADGTSDEEKSEIRSRYYSEGINGFKLFYVEECDVDINVEFWTLIIIKEIYDELPPQYKNPSEGINDSEPIVCTAKEVRLGDEKCKK